jgi:hypothetical protein
MSTCVEISSVLALQIAHMDLAANRPIEMICWIIIGFFQSNLALNLVKDRAVQSCLSSGLARKNIADSTIVKVQTEVLERALKRAQHKLFLLGIDWRPSGSLHFC